MKKPTGRKLLESFLKTPVRSWPSSEIPVNPVPVIPPRHPRADVPVPENMQGLPVDERGYRVPFFVSWFNGKPDFRMARSESVMKCLIENLCWICGKEHELDRESNSYPQTYVIGPMCVINRVSSEPGSHLECARYAARVCPFLVSPHMRRNEKDLPEEKQNPDGLFIKRNPGVSALWTTPYCKIFQENLFQLGNPVGLEFWREGRHATFPEVMESIRTGLPILEKEAEEFGPQGRDTLTRMTLNAISLIAQQYQPTGSS
jgi:hypothetical protein